MRAFNIRNWMPVASVLSPITPAKRVDLTDHVALGKSADRRIARHLADGVGVLGEHQGLAAKPRRCHRGFNSGMACANDDHVIRLGIVELAHFRRRGRDFRPSGAFPRCAGFQPPLLHTIRFGHHRRKSNSRLVKNNSFGATWPDWRSRGNPSCGLKGASLAEALGLAAGPAEKSEIRYPPT